MPYSAAIAATSVRPRSEMAMAIAIDTFWTATFRPMTVDWAGGSPAVLAASRPTPIAARFRRSTQCADLTKVSVSRRHSEAIAPATSNTKIAVATRVAAGRMRRTNAGKLLAASIPSAIGSITISSRPLSNSKVVGISASVCTREDWSRTGNRTGNVTTQISVPKIVSSIASGTSPRPTSLR